MPTEKPAGPPRVNCAQIGARDHYAIPRALHNCGALAGMVTDFWWPWLRPGHLPSLRRLTGRSHPELNGAQVISMGLST
ncbi:MAG: hypothetical protein ACKO2G_02020, partial [Verrucomicrobiales bacterium]